MLVLLYPALLVAWNDCGGGFSSVLLDDGKIVGIHARVNPAQVWCYDPHTGSACQGYPRSLSVGTEDQPYTQAIGNRLYFIGKDNTPFNQASQSGRIYCWDSKNTSFCGQSPVLKSFDQLQLVDGKLYTLLESGQLDCFDPANSLARCLGYPSIDIGVSGFRHPYASSTGSDTLAVGKKLYALGLYVADSHQATKQYRGIESYYYRRSSLNCWDTEKNTICDGWSQHPLLLPDKANLIPRLADDGAITGICAAKTGYRALATQCFDLSGKYAETINMGNSLPSMHLFNRETWSGSRIWFANHNNGLKCWDWHLNGGRGAPCTGVGYFNGETADAGQPYSVVMDGQCIYSSGNTGQLGVWNPVTGEGQCAGHQSVSLFNCTVAAVAGVAENYVPELLDQDDDNDGVLSRYEYRFENKSDTVDSDQDGMVDSQDLDDDNDGKLTRDEWADPNGDGNPGDALDSDADSIPDYLDGSDRMGAVVNMRVFLQGAYDSDTGLMRDTLRQKKLLPLKQPYASLGYTGNETLNPKLLDKVGGDAPVDWILLEIRDRDDYEVIVASVAAIVQRDGDVVDPITNLSGVLIPSLEDNKYYVRVRHRNHLSVITEETVFLSPVSELIDLTLAKTHVGGGKDSRWFVGNVGLLWGGDLNADNLINADKKLPSDYQLIMTDAEKQKDNLEYSNTDLNFDGLVFSSGEGNDAEVLVGNIATMAKKAGVISDFIDQYKIEGGWPSNDSH